MTLLPSGLALLISFRLIGELGAHGLQISSISQVLLIVLLLGAGTDYGLFLVFRVREELREGHEPHEAVRTRNRPRRRIDHRFCRHGDPRAADLAVRRASALYHDLGVPLAVGVAVMLLIGLTLLPALLAILGRRAFWPSKTAAGTQQDAVCGDGSPAGSCSIRGATLAIGVTMFLALAAGALGYIPRASGAPPAAPAGSDAAAGKPPWRSTSRSRAATPPTSCSAYRSRSWGNPNALATAQASLRTSGKFTILAGPLDPNGTTLTPAELTRLHPHSVRPSGYRWQSRRACGCPTRRLQRLPGDRAVHLHRRADDPVRGRPGRRRAGFDRGHERHAGRARRGRSGLRRPPAPRTTAWPARPPAVYDIPTTANHDLRTIIPIAVHRDRDPARRSCCAAWSRRCT